MGVSAQSHSLWLAYDKPKPESRLRLFCFPYSGADASVFAAWQASVPDDIEICPVQLPGRGRRLAEPFVTSLDSLIVQTAQALRTDFESKPFALFGHSLGALICFELARYLRGHYAHMPVHLFVSGCGAPDVLPRENRIHDLCEAEFLDKLRHMNGSLQRLLCEPELQQIFVPILRADFELFETYLYREELPLDCAISAFGGLQDDWVQRGHLESWRRHTTRSFSLRMLPGDHLFVSGSRDELLRALVGQLTYPNRT